MDSAVFLWIKKRPRTRVSPKAGKESQLLHKQMDDVTKDKDNKRI